MTTKQQIIDNLKKQLAESDDYNLRLLNENRTLDNGIRGKDIEIRKHQASYQALERECEGLRQRMDDSTIRISNALDIINVLINIKYPELNQRDFPAPLPDMDKFKKDNELFCILDEIRYTLEK